jgi:hypothetical protein
MKRKKLTRKEKIQKSQHMTELKKNAAERNGAVWLSIVGLIFILFFGYMWVNRNYEIKKEDLVSIEGTVTNQLNLEWRKGLGYSMIIQLEEFPEIDYKVGRFSANHLNADLLKSKVKIGNKINLDIEKNNSSIIRNYNSKVVWVYGLKDDENEYLNVKGYNKERRKDRNSIYMYLLLGFSFWIFGNGIYLYVKNKKKPAANTVDNDNAD